MSTVQVSTKGQIVIPAKIRKELGIKPKSKLEVIRDGDRILVYPIPDDPIEACFGALKFEKTASEIMKETREEEQVLERRKVGGLL
jgi:AbrB family looped-hinge helix DNA binding protein